MGWYLFRIVSTDRRLRQIPVFELERRVLAHSRHHRSHLLCRVRGRAVGLEYSFGISDFTWFALPAVLVSLPLCLISATRIRRTKLYMLPDIFDERFSKPTGILPAILQAFIYSVPTLALQIVAMGYLFQTLFEMSLWFSLVVSWVIISGYTLLGGLPSVILTGIYSLIFVGRERQREAAIETSDPESVPSPERESPR